MHITENLCIFAMKKETNNKQLEPAATDKRHKIMTKQVKIQETESGLKYFNIYEVRVKKHDGEVINYEFYYSKEEAEQTAKFIDDKMQKLYKFAFIRERIVWC